MLRKLQTYTTRDILQKKIVVVSTMSRSGERFVLSRLFYSPKERRKNRISSPVVSVEMRREGKPRSHCPGPRLSSQFIASGCSVSCKLSNVSRQPAERERRCRNLNVWAARCNQRNQDEYLVDFWQDVVMERGTPESKQQQTFRTHTYLHWIIRAATESEVLEHWVGRRGSRSFYTPWRRPQELHRLRHAANLRQQYIPAWR